MSALDLAVQLVPRLWQTDIKKHENEAQAESCPCPKISLYRQTDPPRVTRRRRQVAPRGSLRREKSSLCCQNPGINFGHFGSTSSPGP